MKPPQCAVCLRSFDPFKSGGGLVSFKNYKPLPEGMCGHPKGQEWFCARHMAKAERLAELESEAAIATIRKTAVTSIVIGILIAVVLCGGIIFLLSKSYGS